MGRQLLCCLVIAWPFLLVEATRTVSLLSNVTVSWQQNDTCSEVHDVPSSEKCRFVRTVTDCQPDGGFINYFVFTHCWMPNSLIPLSAFLLVSVWVHRNHDEFYCIATVHMVTVFVCVSWSNSRRLVSRCDM